MFGEAESDGFAYAITGASYKGPAVEAVSFFEVSSSSKDEFVEGDDEGEQFLEDYEKSDNFQSFRCFGVEGLEEI